MSGSVDLDRQLTARLAERFAARATTREPEGLLGASLARVAMTRQRPRWLVSERWTSMTALAVPARPAVRAIWLLAVLAVLVAILVALAIGSRSPHLPVNGPILFARGGDVYRLNGDGTTTDLTPNGGNETSISFSPDGSRLALFETTSDGAQLAVMPVTGTRPSVVPTGQLFHPTFGDTEIPAWSPDGSRVAFGSTVYADANDRGPSAVFVVDLASGRTVQLPLTGMVGADEPAFSPDGSRVAFQGRLAGDGLPVGIDGTPHALFVANADGSDIRRLSPPLPGSYDAVGYGPPSWSPDGKTIAVDAVDTTVNPGPAFRVFAIDVATGAPRQLTTQPLNGYIPRFSPDGQSIAFLDWEPPVGDLWVMRGDGSGQRLVHRRSISDTMSWSPDGQWILFEGLGADNGPDGSIDRVRVDGTGYEQLVPPQASVAPRSGLTWGAQP